MIGLSSLLATLAAAAMVAGGLPDPVEAATPSGKFPVRLAPLSFSQSPPWLAVTGEGATVAAWELTGLRYREVSSRGRMSSVRRLALPGQSTSSFDLAMRRDGTAALAWTGASGTTGDLGLYGIFARIRASDGAIGPVLRISEPSALDSYEQVETVFSPDGGLWFVWTSNGGVSARQLDRNGALGATVTIVEPVAQDAPIRSDYRLADLAVDGRGRVAIAWARRGGGKACAVQLVLLRGAGALEGPTSIAPKPQCDWGALHVTTTPEGDVNVVWSRYLRHGGTFCFKGAKVRVFLRRLSAGGSLGPVRVVGTDIGSDIGVGVEVAASGFSDGRALVVWSGRRVMSRLVRRNGSLGPKVGLGPRKRQLIPRPRGTSNSTRVRVDGISLDTGGKTAVVGWRQSRWHCSGGFLMAPSSVRVRRVSASGRPRRVQAFPPTITFPEVAIDWKGRNARVGWPQSSKGRNAEKIVLDVVR